LSAKVLRHLTFRQQLPPPSSSNTLRFQAPMNLTPLTITLALPLLAAPLAAQGGTWNLESRFDGTAAGDNFGYSVAVAGDVDGDGLPDLISGALWADPGGRSMAGTASVYSGLTGAVLHTFEGQFMRDYLGKSVAGAGDVNGDGIADLIVGAYGADPVGFNMAGSAFIYSGATGAMIHSFDGAAALDQFGWSVSGAGDVNADGYDDFIIGANRYDNASLVNCGAAFVFSGVNGNMLHSFYGTTTGAEFGSSVAGVGDVDGDNFADVLVGAPLSGNTGRAYLYSGQTGVRLFTFDGTSQVDEFGWSVAAAGDVDGDTVPDVIIGADWSNGIHGVEAGAAFVYSGASGLLLHRLEGLTAYDNFGISVDTAGDIDADGHADLLVGAWRASPSSGIWAGEAYLFSGASGNLMSQISGESAGDNFGWSVAGGADLDGNGRPDVIVAAKATMVGGLSEVGSVYVWDFNPDLYQLALNPDPLLGGSTADFSVTGGTPATTTYLAYSLAGTGSYSVPQLGVTLGLANPQLGAGPNLTDALGNVSWTIPIPLAGAGRNVWVQALQMSKVTNVVATSIQ
jgi:hypothetical protein